MSDDYTSPSLLSVLDPLEASRMASANLLSLGPYSPTSASIDWDRWASYSTTQDYALLYETFKISLIQGATYDIVSSSDLDPFVLIVYDQTGEPLVANSEDNDLSDDYDQL